MGFRFRRSVNFGPIRFNLSKSGIGYSVGSKHFRYTVGATGRNRSTINFGGGLSYIQEHKARDSSSSSLGRHQIMDSKYSEPNKPRSHQLLNWVFFMIGLILIVIGFRLL
jgi:Protein of unknown function (DUF4236)